MKAADKLKYQAWLKEQEEKKQRIEVQLYEEYMIKARAWYESLSIPERGYVDALGAGHATA